jgi:hypothetical protein
MYGSSVRAIRRNLDGQIIKATTLAKWPKKSKRRQWLGSGEGSAQRQADGRS